MVSRALRNDTPAVVCTDAHLFTQNKLSIRTCPVTSALTPLTLGSQSAEKMQSISEQMASSSTSHSERMEGCAIFVESRDEDPAAASLHHSGGVMLLIRVGRKRKGGRTNIRERRGRRGTAIYGQRINCHDFQENSTHSF